MTYFTNTSNKDITYKGMTIRPMESILLDDHGFPTKGEVFYAEEKLLALDDSIEKASKKAKEDLGDLDDRIEKKVTSLTGDLVTVIANTTGDVENLNKYTSGMASDIEAAQKAAETANENADKANSELKNKVTLADVNTRLQEVEDKTKTLITSCTSKVNFDLGSYKPVYNDTNLHKNDGKPVGFFSTKCLYKPNIEPGIYLGIMPEKSCMVMNNIPVGKEWKYNGNSSGTCTNEKGCLLFRVTPVICYKQAYNFTNNLGALYVIDEESAKKSYVEVDTMFCPQCACPGAGCKWCSTTNNPYTCVKTCFETFGNRTTQLSNTLIRLQ